MSIKRADPEIMFFLGAGASVKAGIPDTFGLVDKFKERIISQPENLRAVNEILRILRDGNVSRGGMRKERLI